MAWCLAMSGMGVAEFAGGLRNHAGRRGARATENPSAVQREPVEPVMMLMPLSALVAGTPCCKVSG